MPRNIPLLILDDVIIPTSETEIGLSEAESEALRARLSDEVGIVAIVSRPPGHPPRTTLERKIAPQDPGPIMRSCIFGNGRVLAPDGEDPTARLQLTDILRGRLQDVSPGPESKSSDSEDETPADVWSADVEPWSLEGAIPESLDVDELHSGFLRLLLATRDLEASPEAIARQLGRPLRELENTSGPSARLWLLADYLFERPTMRAALLQSETAEALAMTVSDALEVAQTGIPVGPRQLAAPLAATVIASSKGPVAALEDLARIVQTYTPMVVTDDERSDKLEAEARAIAETAASLAAQVDKFVAKLAKATARKPRK